MKYRFIANDLECKRFILTINMCILQKLRVTPIPFPTWQVLFISMSVREASKSGWLCLASSVFSIQSSTLFGGICGANWWRMLTAITLVVGAFICLMDSLTSVIPSCSFGVIYMSSSSTIPGGASNKMCYDPNNPEPSCYCHPVPYLFSFITVIMIDSNIGLFFYCSCLYLCCTHIAGM